NGPRLERLAGHRRGWDVGPRPRGGLPPRLRVRPPPRAHGRRRGGPPASPAGHGRSDRMSGIGAVSGTESSRLGAGEPPRRGSAVPARVGRSPRRAPAAPAEGEDRTRGTRTGEVARAADLGSTLSLGPKRGERGERH